VWRGGAAIVAGGPTQAPCTAINDRTRGRHGGPCRRPERAGPGVCGPARACLGQSRPARARPGRRRASKDRWSNSFVGNGIKSDVASCRRDLRAVDASRGRRHHPCTNDQPPQPTAVRPVNRLDTLHPSFPVSPSPSVCLFSAPATANRSLYDLLVRSTRHGLGLRGVIYALRNVAVITTKPR